jgi:hypothetical protein
MYDSTLFRICSLTGVRPFELGVSVGTWLGVGGLLRANETSTPTDFGKLRTFIACLSGAETAVLLGEVEAGW